MSRKSLWASTAAALALFAAAPLAHAGPITLNSTGIADGFTLSTFVGGYGTAQYGPLAEGVLSNGKIITGSALDNKIYVFNDVDNQTLGSAISATTYANQTGNPNYAMATAGSQVYGAQLQGGTFVKFANDGSSTPLTFSAAGTPLDNLGMWGLSNGDFIAASNVGLIEVNPTGATATYRVINGGLFPDGVTVSSDLSTIYIENGGTIQSYNFTTGAFIHQYNVGHSPDGTGVISGGTFSGDIIVNNNDGTVGLLNPTLPDGNAGQYTIIASGGNRGDFVSPDTNNGTLFLSDYGTTYRLSCGAGCSIGSNPPPSGTPEPGTFILAGAALSGMILARRRMVKK